MPVKISSGTVHQIPRDFKKVLLSNKSILEKWETFTPLARNEWICWITSAKQEETRKKRITVGLDKMRKGMRRPCCWVGCTHRKDKAPSRSQKYMLSKKN